jgi:hypothetical protein
LDNGIVRTGYIARAARPDAVLIDRVASGEHDRMAYLRLSTAADKWLL